METAPPESRWLTRIGIRPGETPLVLLLFSNMFMSGIAIGMLRVCAFTLFLAHFNSEQLAILAILLAVTGTLATLLIDRFTHGFSVSAYLYTILGTIVTGILLYRMALFSTEHQRVIFFLPLFFEVTYMLFSLQFVALLTRLLNVRQSKRLSGLARSGEFAAEMVGGLSVAFLLNFLNVEDLLLVAIAATLCVGAIVQITIRKFASHLSAPALDANAPVDETRMLGMFRLPYIRLIALCYAVYIFAYFFLDVAFYKYAAAQFPDERHMAEFIGQFFAICGFITLFTMVVVFAPFLRKFGILAGVLAFPILVGMGATAVSVLELTEADAMLIFGVMVMTNGLRFVLQSAIWRPSVAILFQVLPDKQRNQGTALLEGIIDPMSGGLAGVCLYFLSDYLGWPPVYFLLVLSTMMVGWIIMGVMVRRMYLSNLVVSIQKRKLSEISINELDNASLKIIKDGINSQYPTEVFYCLNLLEDIEHPEFTELLKQVMRSYDHEIRMNALQRISRLRITPLIAHVLERIDLESEPAVRGQALKTYASLQPPDTVEVLSAYLDAFHRDIRKGALAGILNFDPRNPMAMDYLLSLVRSARQEDLILAAETIGEIGSADMSGFLMELFEQTNETVLTQAIYAAGQVRDPRLLNKLVAQVSNPSLRGPASMALRQYGEAAVWDLAEGLISPLTSRQDKLRIIEIISEIGGEQAVNVFLNHLDHDTPEIQHQIFLGLAHQHYQAAPDDKYLFVNLLDAEVRQITFLLASMEDLYLHEQYRQVHAALGAELDVRRDNMLLLVSFLFSSLVMLDTRANIDSRVSELRIFALEVLDNLLTPEIKEVVLPLLDDLSVGERLAILAGRFPQQQLGPGERFSVVVAQHFDNAFAWTRSVLLQEIGQSESRAYLDYVQSSLSHAEVIVRETAVWALYQLTHQSDPDNLSRTLRACMGDKSRTVADTVRTLLARLPAPE
ncbi:MAG: hypothetical protein KDI36_02470 [Pseudomonadales bacterium]|nr:hypothetical protein [Pseudomonadales bacterium]